MHEIIFDHSEEITADIKTFWFKQIDAYFYTSGQYAFVRIPHSDMDNRGDTRLLSFSSSVTEDLLGFSVKFYANGSTYKQAMLHLKPGDKILVTDPMGDFILPKSTKTPLLFVAAGIGSAPVRSIVKWLIDNGEQRSVKFLYAARNSRDLAFLPVFAGYDMEMTPILSQPNPSWKGEIGHLDANRVVQLSALTTDTLVYVSGATDFVEEIANGLEALGIQRQHIIRDAFTGYAAS